MSLTLLLLNFVLDILAKQQTNRQQTKTGIKVGKKKKLRLFADNILYIQKSKEYTENLLETMTS